MCRSRPHDGGDKSPGPVGGANGDVDGVVTDDDGKVAPHGDGAGGGGVPDLGEVGQRLVRALDPEAVWLSHEHEPWRPPVDRHV